MESTTGYTFTTFVRYFTSERLIIAHGKKGPTALVYLPKDTGKVGYINCKSFQTASLGFEPVSTRLSVARSIR